MKLKVSTFEQEISSASLGSNSIQINEQIKNAFNNQPAGTIFNPSIAVTYSDTAFPSVSEILTPAVIPNYVPKKITPSIYLEDIPNKLTTDIYFTIVPSITDRGTGLLSYSSSHESVANVDASGVVTIFGAGTATITVSLAASADQVYAAASVSKSFTVSLPTPSVSTWTQRGADIYGESPSNFSGENVSLSADGSIVAIGAKGNNFNRGHVRVYKYNANKTTAETNQSLPNFGPIGWNRLGDDIDGDENNNQNGSSVSLSADGSIVAIGAYGNTNYSGHVRVYQYNANKTNAQTDKSLPNFGPIGWNRLGDDIVGEEAWDYSGVSVSLSADGSIVAIGAYGNTNYSGHVRVYQYNANKTTAQTNQSLPNFGPIGWNRLGDDIDAEAAGDQFGWSVSLSADGSIVAIGAYANTNYSGHVRVYEWKESSSSWVQRGFDIDGESIWNFSGESVSLSADGNRLAIGAKYNNGLRGHVRVYEWKESSSSWVQLGFDIDGESDMDLSGESVSLSANGSIVAIGAPWNDGNNGSDSSGHVRVYAWNGTIWEQRGIDIDGEAVDDNSGRSVSLSADGSIVAIGAPYNDGNSNNSGHVRVYKYE
jgi:hypothetical protein